MPTFRSSTHVDSQTTPSLVLSAPATGALFIAWLLWDSGGGVENSTPAGWNLLNLDQSTDVGCGCWWAPSSVASFTWGFSASIVNEGQILGYDGVDSGYFSQAASHSLVISAVNPIATTAVTVPANGWFLSFFAARSGGAVTWTTPSGLTPRDSGGGGAAIASFDSNAADAGSITATSTASPGVGNHGGGQGIALAAGGLVYQSPFPRISGLN
jgi:hypothetical protein